MKPNYLKLFHFVKPTVVSFCETNSLLPMSTCLTVISGDDNRTSVTELAFDTTLAVYKRHLRYRYVEQDYFVLRLPVIVNSPVKDVIFTNCDKVTMSKLIVQAHTTAAVSNIKMTHLLSNTSMDSMVCCDTTHMIST